ncbi:MAG: transglutaminase domain-containing protein [Lachnospiraceae bacterium]|nr:transglutaminase domain-containing protein [Lachnospiraceae bacterium]
MNKQRKATTICKIALIATLTTTAFLSGAFIQTSKAEEWLKIAEADKVETVTEYESEIGNLTEQNKMYGLLNKSLHEEIDNLLSENEALKAASNESQVQVQVEDKRPSSEYNPAPIPAVVEVSQPQTDEGQQLYTKLLDIEEFNRTARMALNEQTLRFMDLSEAILNGSDQRMAFSSDYEARAFIDFFGGMYRLTFGNTGYGFFLQWSNPDGTCDLQYDREKADKAREETRERRAATMQAIIDKYKLHSYTNAYSEIDNITQRISDKLTYDLEDQDVSNYTALQTGEGVCCHYAAAFFVLANTEGIPTEIINGNYTLYDGTIDGHAWCEVHINGETITVDPTNGLGVVPAEDMWRYSRWY